ncbi:MAG: universal stress protein [Dermatophilaceae bacterium]
MVRVVVGWSGSPHSAAAVMWAARVAERTGRELIVVHVTPPASRRLRWHAGLSPLSRTMQRGEQTLRRDVRRRFSRVRMTVRHEVGDTATVLVGIAKTSLLVIGSAGPARVAHRSIGPTVAKIVATARGPLVVVPGLYAEDRDELPVVIGEAGPIGADLVAQFADADMGAALRHTPRERAAKASHATWLVVASCPHEPAQTRAPRLLGHTPVCHCRDLDLLRSAACPVLIVPESVRRHAPHAGPDAGELAPGPADGAALAREGALATVG